jgi:DNA-binding transcriptional MerR regulator
MYARRVSKRTSRPVEGLTIAGLARRSGLDVQVVRFYARIGLIQPAGVSANGYRRFAPSDVRRLLFVKAAQGLGLTLAEAGEVLNRARRRESPCPIVRDIVIRRVEERARELAAVEAQLQHMRRALQVWRGLADSTPSGSEVCKLIDAVTDPEPARYATAVPDSRHALVRHAHR